MTQEQEPVTQVLEHQRKINERIVNIGPIRVTVTERSDGTYKAESGNNKATGSSEAEAIGYFVLLINTKQ